MGQLFTDFANWLWTAVVLPFAEWLKEGVLWVPRKVFGLFMDGLATIVEAIAAPSFLTDGSSFLSAIDGEIVWFLSICEFQTGMTMIVGAYAARFALRRIPFIGG